MELPAPNIVHTSTLRFTQYISGTMPLYPKSSFFNRNDPNVLAARRIHCLELLEFSAKHPQLYNSQVFLNFLSLFLRIRKKFPFSPRKMRFPFKFIKKRNCMGLRKTKKVTAPFFWKISVQILKKFSRESC